MSPWYWLLVSFGVALALYAAFVLTLIISAGREPPERSLASFPTASCSSGDSSQTRASLDARS